MHSTLEYSSDEETVLYNEHANDSSTDEIMQRWRSEVVPHSPIGQQLFRTLQTSLSSDPSLMNELNDESWEQSIEQQLLREQQFEQFQQQTDINEFQQMGNMKTRERETKSRYTSTSVTEPFFKVEFEIDFIYLFSVLFSSSRLSFANLNSKLNSYPILEALEQTTGIPKVIFALIALVSLVLLIFFGIGTGIIR
jgi:hypothetical protein